MKRRSIAALSASLMSSALILAGCGTTASTPSGTTAKSSVGNVATVALTADASPNWWFPIESTTTFSDFNSEMSSMMYKPLLQISSTDSIDYARSLASSVTWNSNGTVYTITLNPKWHWSNGKPVTSSDVVWTMQLIQALSGTKYSWQYGGAGIGGLPTRWKSIQADGLYKVVVTLTKPSNEQWFLHNGLGQITPVPKSVWDIHKSVAQEADFLKSVANSPQNAAYSIVDGPFKYDPQASKPNNQYWTFVPNPHYDGVKASVSKVIYEYETQSSSEFAALKTGKINDGYLPPSLWDSRQKLTGDHLSTAYEFGFAYMIPNLNPKAPGHFAALVGPAYVRRALEMGIDQPGMIKSLYHGHGVVEYSPIPSKPPTVFFDAAIPNPGAYNPAAGKKLLETHGWHMRNGVMISPQGYPFKFTMDYSSGSNTMTDEAQLMKQDWAEEGIDVTLESQPFDTVINDNDQAGVTNWQMAWFGLWTYQPDYYPTGGGLFKTGSGSNSGDYDSKTMNNLINQTYDPGTPAQITAAMDGYQSYAAKSDPYIWMPWNPTFTEVASYLHGVNKWFNPITDLNAPNHWTITH